MLRPFNMTTSVVLFLLLVVANLGSLAGCTAANLASIGIMRVVAGHETSALAFAARAHRFASRWTARIPDEGLVLAALRANEGCSGFQENQFRSAKAWSALQGRCLWLSGHRGASAQVWRRGGLRGEFVQLANYDKNQGHAREALEEYEEALAVDSTYVPALLGMAELFVRTGNPRRAEETYYDAIRRAPDDPRPYATLAFLRWHNGLTDERTEDALKTAIRVASEDRYRRGDKELPWLYIVLGTRYLQTGRPQLAESAALNAVRVAPRIGYGHFVLGEALRVNEKPRRAIIELNRALDLGLSNDWARLGLATAYLDAGQPRKATDEANRLRRRNPDFEGLGALLQRIKNTEASR